MNLGHSVSLGPFNAVECVNDDTRERRNKSSEWGQKERGGEMSVEKESCSWHRLMKLVSFRVDIISHFKRSCLPLFSVSFFWLGFLCCVMRIFVHSLHGLAPKKTHSQSSYVSGTTKRKKKLSWAAHKSQVLSESAKRFCLTLHLTRRWRRGWRRGKWPKVGRKEDLQCPFTAVPGRQAGSWRCLWQGAQELSQLCVECTRPLLCVCLSLWPSAGPLA